VPKHSLSLKLLNVIHGSYRPGEEELLQLAEVAKLNKLYLAFLRNVGNNALQHERAVEEARFKRYLNNVVAVVKVLKDLRHALYKFRRPVDHVSVDLDILIHVDDVPKAVARLKSIGFRAVVIEPYTVTLRRGDFIVDLYTHPAFAWIVYMDGQKLLEDYSEDIEVNGIPTRSLTRDAEVVVTAAHAAYKEHIVLLLDCLTINAWLSGKAVKMAEELMVREALDLTLHACRAIKKGAAEAPYKIPLPNIARLYLEKIAVDPNFRSTASNIMKYLVRRKHSARMVISRLTRRSY